MIGFIFTGFLLIVAGIVSYAIYHRNRIIKERKVKLLNAKKEVVAELPKKDLIRVNYRGKILFMDSEEYSLWFYANRRQRNVLFQMAMKGKNLITGE